MAVEPLAKFRIVYVRLPTAYNPRQVVFISAASTEDAVELWRLHVEQSTGLATREYCVEDIAPVVKPPLGVIHP